MKRIIVWGKDGGAAALVAQALAPSWPGVVASSQIPASLAADEALIYLAAERGDGDFPHRVEVNALAALLLATPDARLVAVVSAAVHPARPGHMGMIAEQRQPLPHHSALADAWQSFEKQLTQALEPRLALLRCAPLLWPGGNGLSRILARRFTVRPLGHDPSLQLLSPQALAKALAALLENWVPGLYQLAPDRVIPLSQARRQTGGLCLPMPHWLLAAGHRDGNACALLDQLRYPMTLDDRATRARLGLEALGGSAEHLADFLGRPRPRPVAYDVFGCDPEYVARKTKTLFRFLHDYYWRVEVEGLEHVPAAGAGMLVGVHRGFMPFDATMLLTEVWRAHTRIVRFLVHPSLLKPPFLADFIRRLGGVIADHDNADRLLAEGNLLGIFPEGIAGAFTPYRDAYRIGRFGRDQYVRIALRNRVPLIPVATIGSAEIFPILGRMDARWVKRWLEWPYLPLTPTFPLAPIPLPSKWHTRYLEPLNIQDQYGPEAANDRQVVRRIGREVVARLQAALDDLRARRPHLFWGKLRPL